MTTPVFWIPPGEAVLDFAAAKLAQTLPVTRQPAENASHLLLPIPSTDDSGHLRCTPEALACLESRKDLTLVGGRLNTPNLAGYSVLDLLEDPAYLASNASLTAHATLGLALECLPVTLARCPVLILGWGRIAQCLAPLLRGLGARVAVYARNPRDRAMIQALGYDLGDLHAITARLVVNTVPAPILEARPGPTYLDLASQPGILGPGVISARGLPGKCVPESSGHLIADCLVRLWKEGRL